MSKPHLIAYSHDNGTGLTCTGCGASDPKGAVVHHTATCAIKPRAIECINAADRPKTVGTRTREPVAAKGETNATRPRGDAAALRRPTGD